MESNLVTSNPLIQKLFVAGAGQMGSGIAQSAASAGVDVTLFDLNDTATQGAVARMGWSLSKLHSKGVISEPADKVLSRIHTVTSLAAAATAEVVIEAVTELEPVKRELFKELDAICPKNVWFASNTSAIPITRLAAATGRADQFCGMHFFNPVPMLSLVEIVRGELTSDDTLARATNLAIQIGKEPIVVRRDKTGFVVNRILGAAIAEAIRLVEDGLADAADIDKAMRLGCAWKMGPLETADLAGLDVVLNMYQAMQEAEPNPVLAPPAMLQQLVEAGKLGRKSGGGFYEHRKVADK